MVAVASRHIHIVWTNRHWWSSRSVSLLLKGLVSFGRFFSKGLTISFNWQNSELEKNKELLGELKNVTQHDAFWFLGSLNYRLKYFLYYVHLNLFIQFVHSQLSEQDIYSCLDVFIGWNSPNKFNKLIHLLHLLRCPELDEHTDSLLLFLHSVPGLKEVKVWLNNLIESWAAGLFTLFLSCSSLLHLQ